MWFFTHKNCRGQKANWGDWKAVWNWLVTKRKTSNWQKLRNWQALWKWQHIVKQRNTEGPADVSHWCKLGDYHCVVDCFYIALNILSWKTILNAYMHTQAHSHTLYIFYNQLKLTTNRTGCGGREQPRNGKHGSQTYCLGNRNVLRLHWNESREGFFWWRRRRSFQREA